MNQDAITRAHIAIRDAEAELLRGTLDPGSIADALQAIVTALQDVEARLVTQQKLLDDRLLRVENNRLFTLWKRTSEFAARALRPMLALIPGRTRSSGDECANYPVWLAHEQSALPSPEQACAAMSGWAGPKISVILAPQSPELLDVTIKSLESQIYRNWELCVALGDEFPSGFDQLSGIRVYRSATGASERSKALNSAARLATGEFLCFPEEGAVLSLYAFYYFAEALQNGTYDLLYSDEDVLDGTGRRTSPLFKPGWSPVLLSACMYLGQLLLVRRGRFFGVNGFREGGGNSLLNDFVLRLARTDVNACHVPRVLYHGRAQRCFPPPPISAPENAVPLRLTAVVCSRSPQLLRKCLRSLNQTARSVVERVVVVSHQDTGPNPAMRQVIEEAGAVEVPYSGVFNFAAMNNGAAHLVQTPGILFLNDDVTASSPGWAEMLGTQIANDQVGVAGAVLRYPSGDIQHAGIVTGIADGVGHVGRHMRGSVLWPWLNCARDVSAVTGACLAIRADLFQCVGGFDPEFPNNYNDVDLCLRLRERGYAVVCVPVQGLVHAECQTRQGIVRFEERYKFYRRWAHVLGRPDPFYSESLVPMETIALNLDGGTGAAGVVRPVSPLARTNSP